MADLGTPIGSKITISKDNFSVSADSNFSCDYKVQDGITLEVSSCFFTNTDK